MGKMTLKRDVTVNECGWLDRDFVEGETVYTFSGVTYGCIGPDGIACSLDPDFGPFFELPRSALEEHNGKPGDTP